MQANILGANELAGLLVGPQLVFVVGVQVQAALLRALPVRRNAFVLVRLVNDLGDQLRPLIDGARVWRRELAAENGILATGGDEKTEEGPDAVYCEAENDDGDEYEYGDASLHGGLVCCAAVSFSQGIGGADQGPETGCRGRGLGEDLRVCAVGPQATMGE
jgi:hypothetical protein